MNDRKLSRRERQIMDILFASGEATVLEIQEKLPDPPTPMAIRRMVQILEEKSQVQRRKQGREFVYMPKQARSRAGSSALSHVIETFFGGSMEDALAAHLGRSDSEFSQEELSRMSALIEVARKKGN
jgi:predicted transcriptional regulator